MRLNLAEMQLFPLAQIWTAPAAALCGQHQHLLSAVPECSLSFASLPSSSRNSEIRLNSAAKLPLVTGGLMLTHYLQQAQDKN